MKNTGIVRKIDPLGRIVLPKELRETLEIYAGDPIEILVDENERILLCKYRRSCIFCGSTENLIVFKNNTVCLNCKNEIIKQNTV